MNPRTMDMASLRLAQLRPRQQGFTLIEVLVAIVVFSFGMLGMVGLQAAAMQANRESRMQNQATALARELAEMMRGNKVIAVKTAAADNPYLVELSVGALTIATPSYCLSVSNAADGCSSPAAVAAAQMTDWLARLDAALPGAQVSVCFDSAPYASTGMPQWTCNSTGRLGVLLSIATTALEGALSRYRGADPVEITEGDERSLIAALGDGRIDLALTLVRAGDTRFEALPLFIEDYRLALPARHPLAARASVAPEEVAGEAMIARRSCEMLAETSRYFTERGVRPPFSLRSGNDDRAMAMVRAGIGITVAPASLGGEGIAMPRLAGFDAVRQIGLLFGSLRPLGDHPLTETLGTLGQDIRTVDDVAVAKATS